MKSVILFFSIGSLISFMTMSIYGPFYTPLANKKEVSNLTVGLIYAIYPIGELFSSVVLAKNLNNVL